MGYDVRDLDKLASNLAKIDAILDEVSTNLAEEAINLTREGWDRQSDPYGSAWAPKKHPDGAAILVRTGALRNSWHVEKANRRGFTVASGQNYAKFHQDGTSRMQPRMMVPRKGDIPGRWQKSFEEVTADILESMLDL